MSYIYDVADINLSLTEISLMSVSLKSVIRDIYYIHGVLCVRFNLCCPSDLSDVLDDCLIIMYVVTVLSMMSGITVIAGTAVISVYP